LRLRRAGLLGLRRPEAGDSITAHVEGENYTLVRAPLIARILAVPSLTGFASMLSGSGLPFMILRGDFVYSGNRLTLDRLLAWGEALGFTDFWVGEHHSSAYENIVMPEIFLGKVLGKDWRYVAADVQAVVECAHKRGALVKVIFENCFLADEHKERLCRICGEVGADFVKTSTGYGDGGATDDGPRPVTVVDAAGIIRHSTQPVIVGQSRASQYIFKRLSTESTDELVVDTPYLTVVEPKTFLIPLGRRLVSSSGAFSGIVVASFRPAAPRGLFRTVDVGEHGIIWVFHPDGRVLFREPSLENPIGTAAAGNPVFDAATRTGGDGQYVGALDANGPIYLSGYYVNATPPLIVAVSLNRNEVLADWWRQARTLVALSTLIVIATLVVLMTLFRQMDAKTRALATALDAEQRARRASDEASRLKEEFLMTVSHELRTPLQSILGWTRVLMAGGRSEAQTAKALETIERNVAVQSNLINDLLDLSRASSGKLRLEMQPTDLGDIVRHVVQTSRPAADAKSIDLDVEVAADVPAMIGDPDRLQQIVWNLVNNAVKFTPEGGRIRIGLARSGATVTIVVEDTGIGIDPAFLPYVFERFRQADSSTTRRHGGLGLGLSIVRHLVELHGGSVTVASDGTDKGARFRVEFPVKMGVAPAIVT
jgi:signal transduction histidine kinase